MTAKAIPIALVVLCLAFPSASDDSPCDQVVEKVRNGTAAGTSDFRPLVELREALILTLGFGLFAVTGFVAYIFNLVRKYVFHDQNDLDTAFDAGGQVSVGLTATTIVSQWTWAATLLQSCTVASKFGISGPFWYAAGASVQIIVFAILSVELKMKAPGAKTYLQVIKARFGAKAHIVYCVFALLTNVLVTTMLMLGGIASMTSLVNGLTTEMAAICLAAVIGTYTLIGGLGATFYVSYFNTALIFGVLISILWKVYSDDGSTQQNPLGDVGTVYDLLSCSSGPAGNSEQSYLTFFSTGGLMFGVINIIGNFGAVFCDQSYWQSTVAARPLEGVWGFISGGLTWFAIPFSMATTVGLAYVALSTVNGEALLTIEEVDKGLVAPVVVHRLMGHTGQVIVLLMILMAVMSTGSAEIIAVTSIIVYDILKDYVCMFRKNLSDSACTLCGKRRARIFRQADKCQCGPVSSCKQCKEEAAKADQLTQEYWLYSCPTHGAYRNYLNLLLSRKNWYIVVVTAATVPLVLMADAAGLNLGWLYLFMGVLIGAAVIPIGMALFWVRTTAAGMISGATLGSAMGLVCWLAVAATLPGGLMGGNFIKNTGDQLSMIVGNLVSILSGGAVCATVSLVGSFRVPNMELEEEWEKTRSLDNPLKPWGPTYQSAYKMESANKLNDRPTFAEVRRYCRKPRITALAAGTGISLVLVILWPAGMLAVGVMNGGQFQHWVNVSQSWAYIAAAFLILVPLIQEIVSVRRQYVINKSVACNDEDQDMEQADGNPEGISYIEKTNQNPQPVTIGSVVDTDGPYQESDGQNSKNIAPEPGDVHHLEDVL
ncbi:urea-proton symporter DUR3-like [Branchiostoma floridae]|uniref:Urea-proton symporter DUR3-like n=1 Tax=Branchiostoma floridae TaxID=7739 RepID=A0A9J7MIU8_BRAFL|nr:urea-proton symporter DUR3-like [Branchiostoma floridae]